jgi:hypothetical protein
MDKKPDRYYYQTDQFDEYAIAVSIFESEHLLPDINKEIWDEDEVFES